MRTAQFTFRTPAQAAAVRTASNGKTMPGSDVPVLASLAAYDATTVFVGGIGPVSEEDLTSFFSSCGAIASVDQGSRRAYVTFAAPAGAQAAVRLTGETMAASPERPVRVELRRIVMGTDGAPLPPRASGRRTGRRGPAVRTRVFVKDVPASVTEEMLSAAMGGAEAGVVRCDIDGKRVGMVEFETADQRQDAIADEVVRLEDSEFAIRASAPRTRTRAPRAGADAAAGGRAPRERRERGPREPRERAPAAILEPENPCEVLVSGALNEDNCRALCGRFGTVTAMRPTDSAARVTADGWELRTFVVTFSNAEDAASAIPALDEAVTTATLVKNADGSPAAAGATVDVKVRARKAGPKRGRRPRGERAPRDGARAPRDGARDRAPRERIADEDRPLDPLSVMLSGPSATEEATALANEFGAPTSVRATRGRRVRNGFPSSRRFVITYGTAAEADAAVAGLNGRTVRAHIPFTEDGEPNPETVTADATVSARIAREAVRRTRRRADE